MSLQSWGFSLEHRKCYACYIRTILTNENPKSEIWRGYRGRRFTKKREVVFFVAKQFVFGKKHDVTVKPKKVEEKLNNMGLDGAKATGNCSRCFFCP